MSLKSHKSTLSNKGKKKSKIKDKTKQTKKDVYVSPLKDYVYGKNGKKKVVAYIRVSTKSESQAKSLKDNQPAIIERMFREKKTKDKYELIGTYAEWHTGTKTLRPVFKELLKDAGIEISKVDYDYFPVPGDSSKKAQGFILEMKNIEASKYDEIWVKSTSRFSRNIDIIPVIEMLIKQSVVIRFLDIDMNTIDNTTSQIAEKILADMKYSENLSRNIKVAKEMAIERGENPLRKTYGYYYEPVSKTSTSRLIENPEEAEIVRFIYNVYLNGFNGEDYGSSRLIKLLSSDIPELNKKPMLTKKGKSFAKSTINKILRNETYAGYKRHGRYSNQGPSTLFNVHEKRTHNNKIKMERDERVDVIVDYDTWKAVQYKLDRESEKRGSNKTPINKSKALYAQYLKCGYCDSNFRYDNNKGNSFYTCATKEEQGFKSCQVNNVYTEQLDELIERFAKTDFNELFKIDVENQVNSLINYVENLMFDMNNSGNLLEYDNIKAKKELAENKLAALIGDSDENIEISTITKLISNLKQNIMDYDKQLKNLTTPTIEKVEIIEKTFKAINSILKYFEDLPESYTSEDLLEKLDKIVVQGKRLVTGNKKGTPILIPYFKFSTSKEVQEFIDRLDIELPSYSYTLVSGIEYFDTIDAYIENEKLNSELKDYLSGFKTLEEAQEHSKTDKYISNELKAYILYFDTLEEALADYKLSPYDKDLRQKDLIKPHLKDIPMTTLDFNLEDLNKRYAETVLTFNSKGEQVEDIGYLFDMGIEGSDTMTAIKSKLSNLESAFDNLIRQHNRR